jgi:outer membrane protein assembly factor BamD
LKLNRFAAIPVVLLAALLLAGCRHGQGQRPLRPVIDPELVKLSKEQVYQRGEDMFAKKRFQKARTYFSHVYENYPNDPLGRRALLRVADSYYAQADAVNLVEAQYKYRDFINRYPGSDKADYAMLQIAMVSVQQMEKPDRDQQKTREALEKLSDMIRTYPRSPLRAEADKRLNEVLDRLAKHEHLIARYYIRRHSFRAAEQRLNYLNQTYPNYADRAGVFFDLGTALDGLGRKPEARLYFERVIQEYPKSEYTGQAKKRLDQIPAKQADKAA